MIDWSLNPDYEVDDDEIRAFFNICVCRKKRGEIVSEKREILFNWSIICMYLYYFIFEGWFIFSFKFKNYIDLGYEL